MENLPTTVVGLIAFICAGSLCGMAWQARFFMTYIQKKNANLERTTQAFMDHLERQRERHDDERRDWETRLRQCLLTK